MVHDLHRFICSLLLVLHYLVYFVQCVVVSSDVYHPFCNITKSQCSGQYPDCVGFDPMHNVEINAKAESKMPDFSNLGDEIMAIFKKSPFGKLFSE